MPTIPMSPATWQRRLSGAGPDLRFARMAPPTGGPFALPKPGALAARPATAGGPLTAPAPLSIASLLPRLLTRAPANAVTPPRVEAPTSVIEEPPIAPPVRPRVPSLLGG